MYNQKDTTIPKKVKPTEALFFCSMPCEEGAAHVRNEAISSMAKNDSLEVYRRYDQSARGRCNATQYLLISCHTFLFSLFMIPFGIEELLDERTDCKDCNPVIALFGAFLMLMLSCGLFRPTCSSYNRLGDTMTDCEKWLKEKYGNNWNDTRFFDNQSDTSSYSKEQAPKQPMSQKHFKKN